MRCSYIVPIRWMVIYEYEVPGRALNLNSTKLPRPWSPWGSSPSRKNPHGRTGNRTWDLMISSRKLRPLDHEAGRIPFKYSDRCCRTSLLMSFFLAPVLPTDLRYPGSRFAHNSICNSELGKSWTPVCHLFVVFLRVVISRVLIFLKACLFFVLLRYKNCASSEQSEGLDLIYHL
jgi:hypothetical protein